MEWNKSMGTKKAALISQSGFSIVSCNEGL
jgi:hypothetical protein